MPGQDLKSRLIKTHEVRLADSVIADYRPVRDSRVGEVVDEAFFRYRSEKVVILHLKVPTTGGTGPALLTTFNRNDAVRGSSQCSADRHDSGPRDVVHRDIAWHYQLDHSPKLVAHSRTGLTRADQ